MRNELDMHGFKITHRIYDGDGDEIECGFMLRGGYYYTEYEWKNGGAPISELELEDRGWVVKPC